MNLRIQAWMTAAATAILTVAAPLGVIAFEAPTDSQLGNVREAQATARGTQRALIVCGLSGDADHHKLFAETVAKLHEGLTKQLGFGATNVVVLFGDEAKEADRDVIKSADRATREELEKAANRLRDGSGPDDSLWVIIMGHSHYDGRHSWLNLAGQDIQETEFGKLFGGLKAREQVFLITTPASGFYIKPLTAKGRVVISATEEAWETNETEFPIQLARVLATPPATNEFDIDGDGSITVFDLYITVARNLAQSYLDGELLATEHSLLDDNGDGRGAELQIDFLTVEQGGRMKPGKPVVHKLRPNSDGSVAKSVRLAFSFKAAVSIEINESSEPADASAPSNVSNQ